MYKKIYIYIIIYIKYVSLIFLWKNGTGRRGAGGNYIISGGAAGGLTYIYIYIYHIVYIQFCIYDDNEL